MSKFQLYLLMFAYTFMQSKLLASAQYWNREPYPDLSCHEHYETESQSNKPTGNHYIRSIMGSCSAPWQSQLEAPKCFKRCIFERLNILKHANLAFEDEEKTTNRLHQNVFPNHLESAEQMAKRVQEECTPIMEQLANSPNAELCEEQEALYTCFEKAMVIILCSEKNL